MRSACATRWQGRWGKEPVKHPLVQPAMGNTPKQPDELPPEGSVDPESVEHTEHGIPPEAQDAEPTGLPNSDRHHGEITPTKR